jgi:aminoglycoside/choline kinase family phosphotransferase
MHATPADQPLAELFARRFGGPVQGIGTVKADGSDRKLFRLSGASRTAIGVVSPDARETRAFLEFSRHFRKCGLPVPEIYAEDLQRGLYLEEDLGEVTLFQLLSVDRSEDRLGEEVLAVYRAVVEWLPRFQIQAGRTLNYTVCHPRPSFDKQSMMWDLN